MKIRGVYVMQKARNDIMLAVKFLTKTLALVNFRNKEDAAASTSVMSL